MNAPFFNWGDKGGDSESDKDRANSLGADAGPAPSGGSVAQHQMSASAEAAKTAANLSPRKRGRPRSDGSDGTRSSRDLQAQIDGAIASQLDALHDPESWGALLALPGDAIQAITGRERWEIRKDERRTLGLTGSAFARTLMITNPRALAAMMLAAALFSVYGVRAIAEVKELRVKKPPEVPKADDGKKAG
jgi:hypothetical protein